MHISITTELLGEHPPLLDIAIPEIADDALTSWVRGGDGLIGFGIYKSHVVKGANRFEQARSWWREQVNALDITTMFMAPEPARFSLPPFHLMKQRIQY